ncbi:hypothetical protein QJN72_24770, partial [Escherichia coli]
SIFSHPVYLFLRKFSLQDSRGGSVAAIAPSLSTSTQTRVSASSCKVEFRHGNMTLENPSPELLTVLIRELTGRGR